MITCAHCGTAIPTPTGRASRKRFCTTECRKAAWRERHRNDTNTDADTRADLVPNIVPGVLTVPTAFPDDVPNPGGQHRCPHCRQPLAIISVVIPADAAIVRAPEVPPTTHNSANLNPPPGEDDLATLGNFDERQHQRSRRPKARPHQDDDTHPVETDTVVEPAAPGDRVSQMKANNGGRTTDDRRRPRRKRGPAKRRPGTVEAQI